MSNYSHVLCALIIVNFICSERTIHSYRDLCDPQDILLIFPYNLTRKSVVLFSEIGTITLSGHWMCLRPVTHAQIWASYSAVLCD